jgi:hypothetical protein
MINETVSTQPLAVLQLAHGGGVWLMSPNAFEANRVPRERPEARRMVAVIAPPEGDAPRAD